MVFSCLQYWDDLYFSYLLQFFIFILISILHILFPLYFSSVLFFFLFDFVQPTDDSNFFLRGWLSFLSNTQSCITEITYVYFVLSCHSLYVSSFYSSSCVQSSPLHKRKAKTTQAKTKNANTQKNSKSHYDDDIFKSALLLSLSLSLSLWSLIDRR